MSYNLAAQHSTAQHSTAQHSTAQHSTAQHSTAHLVSYEFVCLLIPHKSLNCGICVR
ncbi:hypothetical protein NF716_07870 [Lactococcus formosensis]|uniref:hypothetical protein n=1 Tax=Lactococcus formosensis TaxID=1281486 RepID=UPI002435A090|nr:hypothetical protein [Lactococcus formosensis]MDG6121835.1 hypothetical protein [Lactococcus formosensis]MDG6128319.1 hypothetical protein [Lactococcus formosensis]MDG6156266.1 hypothetical protein [Lactococcus formosensis]MDG6163862.1 hypothetical protein [Lactococcus formosensis]MDG6168361.1 hypothetical protein [Lactococcus formosensis]